jgi:hypothetical protein
MAELLAIVGGIASFAQLLGYVIQTSEAVAKFCDDFQDAPSRVHRTKEELCLLRKTLEGIQSYLQVYDDTIIFPPDLKQVLMESIRRISTDIKDLQNETERNDLVLQGSLRKRLRWTLIERRKTEKLLSRFEESESTLDRVIQLVNL